MKNTKRLKVDGVYHFFISDVQTSHNNPIKLNICTMDPMQSEYGHKVTIFTPFLLKSYFHSDGID